MNYSEIKRSGIREIDGIGSGIDADLVRGEYIDFLSFKNKIINGDMSVTQRGRMFSFENNGDYTADRWYSEIQGGKEYVRQEIVWSKDEGTWKNETDPFGDGSQHNLWQFDGDATDTNGNNDGTLNGDANFVDDYLPGIGSCKVLNLDGDGDYVSTDFKIGNQTKYTLSTWFKTNDLTSSALLKSTNSNDDSKYRRGSFFFDGDLLFYFHMGDDTNYSFKAINVDAEKYTDNTWHNIVLSIDGYKQTLYIDNKFIVSVTLDVSAGTASDYTYSIGRNGEQDSGYFKGQLARTRIFLDKALTQDEVYKLYVEDSKYIQQKQLRSIITNDNTITKYQPFVYRFEGQDLIDYINDKVTISFNVRSNQTGDFTLSLINKSTQTDIESYVTKFNYSLDTKEFQRVNVTILLSDFTKFIRDDEELGFELIIAGIGDETDTEGRQDGEYYYLKDTIKLSTNDWISITDVQLEKGDVVTEFERVSYEMNVTNVNAPFNLGIGSSGYKWVDETANRDLDTTYTNTTGKPIQILVTTVTSKSYSKVSITIDGILMSNKAVVTDDNGSYGSHITATIPVGSTYKCGGSDGDSLDMWFELK